MLIDVLVAVNAAALGSTPAFAGRPKRERPVTGAPDCSVTASVPGKGKGSVAGPVVGNGALCVAAQDTPLTEGILGPARKFGNGSKAGSIDGHDSVSLPGLKVRPVPDLLDS